MKQILVLILLTFMSGCSSVKELHIWYPYLQRDADIYITAYYYTYLRFPNVEELFKFCWDITNSHYKCRFASYAEYKKEGKHDYYVGHFLDFLMENKKNLSFKVKDGEMLFYWKSKIVSISNFDLCEQQKDRKRVWQFFHLFDSTGTRITICDNVMKDFDEPREVVKNTWLAAHKQENHVFDNPTLLRYNRTQGYTLYCPSDSITTENSYLKDLRATLDTFLVNRNAETIQFITLVPRLRERISELGQ